MNKKMSWLGLVPVFFFLALFLFPIYWAICTSFKDRIGCFQIPPEWLFAPTLDAYKGVMEEGNWSRAYFNTILIAFGSVFIALLAGLLAAYIIAKIKRHRLRMITLFMVIFTRMLPSVVLGIPLFIILRNCGLLDKHVPLMFVYSTIHLPYVIWMMTGFFGDVPPEMEEAAWIDGASTLQTLWKIIIPQVLPGIVATSLYCLIISWNEFFFALILTRFNAVTIPVVMASFLKVYTIEWAKMCAGTVLIIAPVIVVSFIIYKHLARGLAGGGIKE